MRNTATDHAIITRPIKLLVISVKVLEALAAGSGRCVRVLNIEDFFHSRLAIFRNSRFHQVINRFKDISSFYLNYNCMSEELVRNMATTCAGKLLHISIKVRSGAIRRVTN